MSWADNIIGNVIKQLTIEFPNSLNTFWFSHYISQIGAIGEDIGDCDINLIPDNFKQPFIGFPHPGHRSIRFRFDVNTNIQQVFEQRLKDLVIHFGFTISDIRDYDQVADLGGSRFISQDKQQREYQNQRAQGVTNFLHSISVLYLDTLIGPDEDNQYYGEQNNDKQNPNGSCFESLHHLFCNITQVPITVFLGTADQKDFPQTYWGVHRGKREIQINGQLVKEFFLTY
jgi:hypothetical protein